MGRLAMPIVAFLLVEGYHHTSRLGGYLLRLLVFAVLTQPVYRLVFPHGLNVFFDLLVGLCLLWAVQRIRSRWLTAALLLAVGAAGFYVTLDWWHLGIFMVYIFGATRGRFGWTVAALSGLLLANAGLFAGLFAVVSARTGDSSYQLMGKGGVTAATFSTRFTQLIYWLFTRFGPCCSAKGWFLVQTQVSR